MEARPDLDAHIEGRLKITLEGQKPAVQLPQVLEVLGAHSVG
jgi:hypothetical protein